MTNSRSPSVSRSSFGFALLALLLGGCSDAPAPAPRYISSDALAFTLELAQGQPAAPIAPGAFSGGVRAWEVDGRPVARDGLGEIDPSTVRWVVLDTLRGVVRLHSDPEPRIDPALIGVQVFSSATLAGQMESGVRYPTLFWLADVVLSGNDMAALGPRRSSFEGRLADVTIFYPERVARVLGAEADVTVVVAGSTRDIYPLLPRQSDE